MSLILANGMRITAKGFVRAVHRASGAPGFLLLVACDGELPEKLSSETVFWATVEIVDDSFIVIPGARRDATAEVAGLRVDQVAEKF